MFNCTKISQQLVVAVAFLCSCSQTDDITVGDSKETLKEGNIVFRLQSNSSNATRSAEDSYEHVQGTVDEYKVNVARVYFFDNVTKHFAKSVPLTNITRKGSDADGNVIYETDPISIAQGVYDIFVTANTYRQIKTDTEEQFLADIDSVTYAQALIEDISGGIVMSNRAADNEATIITETPNENDVNVVNIKLERVLARLDIAKSLETYELTDPNGVKYASVKLNGYYIVNLPKYYYTFRHVAVLLSLTEPQWNIQANFGNVADVNGYVIDPYFFKKTINASGFTNADQYYVNYFGDNTKENPLLVTAISLYGYFTKLIKLHCTQDKSQGNLASVLGVAPFFVRDYQTAARNYPPQVCIRNISILREFDMKSKGYDSGNTSEKDLYREMIFKLMH